MSQRDDEEILYECECFRVVRFVDDEGSANVSISFFDHGVDLYLSEEEFAHFAEALGGLHEAPWALHGLRSLAGSPGRPGRGGIQCWTARCGRSWSPPSASAK